MHIMLFDDHELFAKSLEISISNSVTKFETYTSPANILNILEKKLPDILLMDIHMGDFNGLDISQMILEKYPSLKIIFLSGYDLVEYHNKAIKMGAKGFISKNISINSLIGKIKLVADGAIIFPKYDSEIEPLTDREKEILQLTSEGLRQQEVADKLFISRRTVNNHIQTINEKFSVNSSIAATVRGIELGIVKLKHKK
ncbi:response regulator transcription factor [Paenibacillus sp. IHBB 10380]|uniref:response regulator transcription factor n=1 Tax=Paenibacillus sp. IHBB 10380 TaxID=1566358 RepID=UPI0005CFE118|nr:response regulator transcription factor [Paenibacillus sp. IHBB 10380]AJS61082.1 hypothetical protein UB51_24560 [Paenibacillus sp. IHBB 10380]